ncbi:MAG: hypothetical protein ACPGJS_13505 [Flammeovirgaceae bacterium]
MRTVLFVLVCLGMMACQPDSLNEQELNAYIQDESNGLIKKQTRKGIDVAVACRPTDLLVAQELRAKPNHTTDFIDSLKQKYDQYAYFMLSLSKGNQEVLRQTGDFSSFSNTLQTLSFDMASYVNITTSQQDTISVADFIYPRLYGASQNTSLLFVFRKDKINATEWVQFNLKEFGLGIGVTRFRFETSALQNIPQLVFEK